jgi:hypothetical protein
MVTFAASRRPGARMAARFACGMHNFIDLCTFSVTLLLTR